jgi:hypothetical protein
MLEAVFSLQSDLKLYKEYSTLLKTMVSSQSQHTETQELEGLITMPISQQWSPPWQFPDCTIPAFGHHFTCQIHIYMVL